MDAEQACRETTRAPQALATRPASAQPTPPSQALSSPARKASPAPRTFITLTGNPGTTVASSSRDGTGPSITAHPSGPSFTTSTAGVRARTRRSEVMGSASPPAMWNSSTVPTTRSKRGRISCRCAVTRSLATNRCAPAPGRVRPHSTGR